MRNGLRSPTPTNDFADHSSSSATAQSFHFGDRINRTIYSNMSSSMQQRRTRLAHSFRSSSSFLSSAYLLSTSLSVVVFPLFFGIVTLATLLIFSSGCTCRQQEFSESPSTSESKATDYFSPFPFSFSLPSSSSRFFFKGVQAAKITVNTIVGGGGSSFVYRGDEVSAGIYLQLNTTAMTRGGIPLYFEFSGGVVGPFGTVTNSRSFLQIYGVSTLAEVSQTGPSAPPFVDRLGPLTVVVRNNMWTNSQFIVKDYFPAGTSIALTNNTFAQVPRSNVGNLNYVVLFYSSTFVGSNLTIASNYFRWDEATTSAVVRGFINIAGQGPGEFVLDNRSYFTITNNTFYVYTATSDTRSFVGICYGAPVAPSNAVIRNFHTRVLGGSRFDIQENAMGYNFWKPFSGYAASIGFLAPLTVSGASSYFAIDYNEYSITGYSTFKVPYAVVQFVSQLTVTTGGTLSFSRNAADILTDYSAFVIYFQGGTTMNIAATMASRSDSDPTPTLHFGQFLIVENKLTVTIFTIRGSAAFGADGNAFLSVSGPQNGGNAAGDACILAPGAGVSGTESCAAVVFSRNHLTGAEFSGFIIDSTPRLLLQAGGGFYYTNNQVYGMGLSTDTSLLGAFVFSSLIINGTGSQFAVSDNTHNQGNISTDQQWRLMVDSLQRPLIVANGGSLRVNGNRFNSDSHYNHIIVVGSTTTQVQIESVSTTSSSSVLVPKYLNYSQSEFSIGDNFFGSSPDTIKRLGISCALLLVDKLVVTGPKSLLNMSSNRIFSGQPQVAVDISFISSIQILDGSTVTMNRNTVTLTNSGVFSGVGISNIVSGGVVTISDNSKLLFLDNTNRYTGAATSTSEIIIRPVGLFATRLLLLNSAQLIISNNKFWFDKYPRSHYMLFAVTVMAVDGMQLSGASTILMSENIASYTQIQPAGRPLSCVGIFSSFGSIDVSSRSKINITLNSITVKDGGFFTDASDGSQGDEQDSASGVLLQSMSVRVTDHSQIVISDVFARMNNVTRTGMTMVFIIQLEPLQEYPSMLNYSRDVFEGQMIDFYISGNSSFIVRNVRGGDATGTFGPLPTGVMATHSFDGVSFSNYRAAISSNSFMKISEVFASVAHGFNSTLVEVRPYSLHVAEGGGFYIENATLTVTQIWRTMAQAMPFLLRVTANPLTGLTCSSRGVGVAVLFIQISDRSVLTISNVEVIDQSSFTESANLCRRLEVVGVLVRAHFSVSASNILGAGIVAVYNTSSFEVSSVRVTTRETLNALSPAYSDSTTSTPLSPSSFDSFPASSPSPVIVSQKVGLSQGMLIPTYPINPISLRNFFGAIVVDLEGRFSFQRGDVSGSSEDGLLRFDYAANRFVSSPARDLTSSSLSSRIKRANVIGPYGSQAEIGGVRIVTEGPAFAVFNENGGPIPLTRGVNKVIVDSTSRFSLGTSAALASATEVNALSKPSQYLSASSPLLDQQQQTPTTLFVSYEKRLVFPLFNKSGAAASSSVPEMLPLPPFFPASILRPPLKGSVNISEHGSPLDLIVGIAFAVENLTLGSPPPVVRGISSATTTPPTTGQSGTSIPFSYASPIGPHFKFAAHVPLLSIGNVFVQTINAMHKSEDYSLDEIHDESGKSRTYRYDPSSSSSSSSSSDPSFPLGEEKRQHAYYLLNNFPNTTVTSRISGVDVRIGHLTSVGSSRSTYSDSSSSSSSSINLPPPSAADGGGGGSFTASLGVTDVVLVVLEGGGRLLNKTKELEKSSAAAGKKGELAPDVEEIVVRELRLIGNINNKGIIGGEGAGGSNGLPFSHKFAGVYGKMPIYEGVGGLRGSGQQPQQGGSAYSPFPSKSSVGQQTLTECVRFIVSNSTSLFDYAVDELTPSGSNNISNIAKYLRRRRRPHAFLNISKNTFVVLEVPVVPLNAATSSSSPNNNNLLPQLNVSSSVVLPSLGSAIYVSLTNPTHFSGDLDELERLNTINTNNNINSNGTTSTRGGSFSRWQQGNSSLFVGGAVAGWWRPLRVPSYLASSFASNVSGVGGLFVEDDDTQLVASAAAAPIIQEGALFIEGNTIVNLLSSLCGCNMGGGEGDSRSSRSSEGGVGPFHRNGIRVDFRGLQRSSLPPLEQLSTANLTNVNNGVSSNNNNNNSSSSSSVPRLFTNRPRIGDGASVSVAIRNNFINIRSSNSNNNAVGGGEGNADFLGSVISSVISSSSDAAAAGTGIVIYPDSNSVTSPPPKFNVIPSHRTWWGEETTRTSSSPRLLHGLSCPYNSTRVSLEILFSDYSKKRFRGTGGGAILSDSLVLGSSSNASSTSSSLIVQKSIEDAKRLGWFSAGPAQLILPSWSQQRDGPEAFSDGVGVSVRVFPSAANPTTTPYSSAPPPPPTLVFTGAFVSVEDNSIDLQFDISSSLAQSLILGNTNTQGEVVPTQGALFEDRAALLLGGRKVVGISVDTIGSPFFVEKSATDASMMSSSAEEFESSLAGIVLGSSNGNTGKNAKNNASPKGRTFLISDFEQNATRGSSTVTVSRNFIRANSRITPLFGSGNGSLASVLLSADQRRMIGMSMKGLCPASVVDIRPIPMSEVKGISVQSFSRNVIIEENSVNVSRQNLLSANSLSLSNLGGTSSLCGSVNVSTAVGASRALDAARGIGLFVRFAEGGWWSADSSSSLSPTSSSSSSPPAGQGGPSSIPLSMSISNNSIMLSTSYAGEEVASVGPSQRQSLVSLARLNAPELTQSNEVIGPRIEIIHNKLSWRANNASSLAAPIHMNATISDSYIRWELGSVAEAEVAYSTFMAVSSGSRESTNGTVPMPFTPTPILFSDLVLLAGGAVGLTDNAIESGLSDNASLSSADFSRAVLRSGRVGVGSLFSGNTPTSPYPPLYSISVQGNTFGSHARERVASSAYRVRSRDFYGKMIDIDSGGGGGNNVWASTLVPHASALVPEKSAGGLVFSNFFSSLSSLPPNSMQSDAEGVLRGRSLLEISCNFGPKQNYGGRNNNNIAGDDDSLITPIWPYSSFLLSRPFVFNVTAACTRTMSKTITFHNGSHDDDPPRTRTVSLSKTKSQTVFANSRTHTRTRTKEIAAGPTTTPAPTTQCDGATVANIIRSFLYLWAPSSFVTTDEVIRNGAVGAPSGTATSGEPTSSSGTTNRTAARTYPALNVRMSTNAQHFFKGNMRTVPEFLADWQSLNMPLTAAPPSAGGSGSGQGTSSSSASLYADSIYLPMRRPLPAARVKSPTTTTGAGSVSVNATDRSSAYSYASIGPLVVNLRRVRVVGSVGGSPTGGQSRERNGFGGWVDGVSNTFFPSFPSAGGAVTSRPSTYPDGVNPSAEGGFFNISIFQPTLVSTNNANSSSAVDPTNVSLHVSFSPTPSYSVVEGEFVELYTSVNDAMRILWNHFIDQDVMRGLANGTYTLPYNPALSAGELQEQQIKLESTYTHLIESVFSESCKVAYGTSGDGGSLSSPTNIFVGSIAIRLASLDVFTSSVQVSATAMSGASTVIGILTSSFMGASDMQALGAFALHSCADSHTRKALGSYRILSPFAFWESYYGVIVGNLVTVGALGVAQLTLLVLVKLFYRRTSDWMVSMALVRFPGLTLNVLFTLLTGSLFAAGELTVNGGSDTSERVVGIVGIVFGLSLPFLLIFAARRFITRAYQSYNREDWVAEKGYFVGGKHTDDDEDDGNFEENGIFSSKRAFKKWLLFFIMPEGVIYSPQTRQAFLSYISLYRRPEVFWPSYATWGPVTIMVAGFTSSVLRDGFSHSDSDGEGAGGTFNQSSSSGDPSFSSSASSTQTSAIGCTALYGVMGLFYLILAISILFLKPFRSRMLNLLEALSKIINAAILACIGIAVYKSNTAANAAKVSVFIGLAQVALCVIRVIYMIVLVYFDFRMKKDLVGLTVAWSIIANNMNQRGNRRKFGMGNLFGGARGRSDMINELDDVASRRQLEGDDGGDGGDFDDPLLGGRKGTSSSHRSREMKEIEASELAKKEEKKKREAEAAAAAAEAEAAKKKKATAADANGNNNNKKKGGLSGLFDKAKERETAERKAYDPQEIVHFIGGARRLQKNSKPLRNSKNTVLTLAETTVADEEDDDGEGAEELFDYFDGIGGGGVDVDVDEIDVVDADVTVDGLEEDLVVEEFDDNLGVGGGGYDEYLPFEHGSAFVHDAEGGIYIQGEDEYEEGSQMQPSFDFSAGFGSGGGGEILDVDGIVADYGDGDLLPSSGNGNNYGEPLEDHSHARGATKTKKKAGGGGKAVGVASTKQEGVGVVGQKKKSATPTPSAASPSSSTGAVTVNGSAAKVKKKAISSPLTAVVEVEGSKKKQSSASTGPLKRNNKKKMLAEQDETFEDI